LQNYQLKLDLYEKRYKYYLQIRSILYPNIHDYYFLENTNYQELKKLTDRELKFLFDEEIIENFKKIQMILDLETGSVGNKKIQYMKERIKHSEKLLGQ